MKSLHAPNSWMRLAAVLATPIAISLTAGEAVAGPQRTWNYLTTGNGFGFQVFDTNARKITSFLDHPYRYIGPRADPKSDGYPRRNLAFDVYFGIKAGGNASWLNEAPAAAGDTSYLDETNIIHTVATLGAVTADSYFFAPFDFQGNFMVALLHAPGASDGYVLLNFHMGGTQDDPTYNGESLNAISAQQAISETGPGGGAMVYVPLGGVDHADCQNVYTKAKSGQDLGNNTGCSGADMVPGFQKKLGGDGWWAVGIGFTENAGNASNMAQQISAWANGRSPSQLLSDAQAEWNTWRKPPPNDRLCNDKHVKTWRQAEAVLRMGQVREVNTSNRKNHGMMLASLPPGEWHTGWVRDGAFATVALARSGHVNEARDSLDFFMNASPVSKYKSYVSNQDYRISVCRYFGSGEEEADYSGQNTPNVETDGWGMVLWAARQYVDASGDTAWLSSTYPALVSGIAKPMEANLESAGIMKADSGIWEVHDANKRHFAFTTMSAARGFCDLAALAKKAGNTADATKYAALAKKVKTAFLGSFLDQNGALGGSLEGISAGKYYDGAVAVAFTWNILDDWTGSTANKTLEMLGQLKVQSGGFKRNNDGLSTYDNNEWILVDLLIADALRRNGKGAEADSYINLVVDQAAANYYLLPELYNDTPTDGAIGKYTGSIPMVGYGGGAYILTMLDRGGLIEPNDCGDGPGKTLPVVCCSGGTTCDSPGSSSSSSGGDTTSSSSGSPGSSSSSGSPGSSSSSSSSAGGTTNPGGVGGGGGAAPLEPYGSVGACLCRVGSPGAPGSFAFVLLGGAPALLVLRRRARRAGRG